MTDFRPETLWAIDAVTRGLDLARGRAGADEVTSKGDRDLVTATDVAVEDLVREALSGASRLPVVGEERGGRATDSPYWLVDPICGTRNFASGTPLYCVNLALVEGGRVTVAAVGDPSTNGIALAEQGRGAWVVNDGVPRRLAASGASRTLVVDVGKSKGARRELAARFSASTIRTDRWDFRSLGTTLALPYVAAGRVSAYAVFWITAIHAAPGSLLVTEAGGTVSDIEGRPWSLDSDSLLASADADLHRELLALARQG